MKSNKIAKDTSSSNILTKKQNYLAVHFFGRVCCSSLSYYIVSLFSHLLNVLQRERKREREFHFLTYGFVAIN